MLREIILDTETTGLDPKSGHRLVEIGCVELVNNIPTGEIFHTYINPQRPVPEEATRIHGLTTQFLSDKPSFENIANQFLEFISQSRLVIHNAAFDMSFLNFELARINLKTISNERVLDTLQLARRKHPGSSNNLDALCQRYKIKNSHRTKHGALLDAEILAEVYIELIGARQTSLSLSSSDPVKKEQKKITQPNIKTAHSRSKPLPTRLSEKEKQHHRKLLENLNTQAIWLKY